MEVWSRLQGLYEDLWRAFIRPPRDEYVPSQLGPADFFLDGRRYRRWDFQVINARRERLQCSHFLAYEDPPVVTHRRPCVVYLHGNCSSRLEAIGTKGRELLLPRGISLCCFDFAGSGLSDGDWVTLGANEKDDLAAVVRHLRTLPYVSSIGLWGRSMGAVTAVMYAAEDPNLAGIVIDSAFASLPRLAEELSRAISIAHLPFVQSAAMYFIKQTVMRRVSMNIEHLKPIAFADKCPMPALFVASKEDVFINPQHTRDLYEKWIGEKELVLVDGDHNSLRATFLLETIADFFVAAFELDNSTALARTAKNVTSSATARRDTGGVGGCLSVYERVAALQCKRERERRGIGVFDDECFPSTAAMCSTPSTTVVAPMSSSSSSALFGMKPPDTAYRQPTDSEQEWNTNQRTAKLPPPEDYELAYK